MKPPSTALLRAFSPLRQPNSAIPWTARGCLSQPQNACFSSTPNRQKRNRKGPKKDQRITEIRYFLSHPSVPRPLRFSRTRALRHWTINRAWRLHQFKQRQARELELEKQYNSMANACEALRLIDSTGMTAAEKMKHGAEAQAGNPKDEGRLYRIAMQKDGVWDGVPVEYARIQTETPSRNGWYEGWTR